MRISEYHLTLLMSETFDFFSFINIYVIKNLYIMRFCRKINITQNVLKSTSCYVDVESSDLQI